MRCLVWELTGGDGFDNHSDARWTHLDLIQLLFPPILAGFVLLHPTAAVQPLAGKLTNIFSRRTGLLVSNVLFAVGNLICGLADDQWTMILGRVVAGAGGGGINAISTFVGSDLIPLRRRGLWQGLGNIAYGVGSGMGGIFGGWIHDTYGWRWAFYLQVPAAVLSGLAVYWTVQIPSPVTEKAAWKRIDYSGAVTLVTALVLLLLGMNSGGNLLPWSHPSILLTFALSALFLLAFIYVEAYVAEEPVIPVRLFFNRTVLAACLANWFITMVTFGLLFYGPIYLQVLKGLSATQAGICFLPYSVGFAVGSMACGMMMWVSGRYFTLNIVVQAILVTAFVLVSKFDGDTPAWLPFLAFLMVGFGSSGMLTVNLIALISPVDHQYQAVITSASYAFRSTGSTIGITIASSVFRTSSNQSYGRNSAIEMMLRLLFNRFVTVWM